MELSCGNHSMRGSCRLIYTHHRPSGCFGIPWASVKSEADPIVYIAPKNRNENKRFSAFFLPCKQLHSNTEIRRIQMYLTYNSLDVCTSIYLAIYSNCVCYLEILRSARSSPSLISYNLLLAKFIDRIYRTEIPNFQQFFTVESVN